MRIRAATPDDSAAISEIYAPYVSASAVSFEAEPPGPEEIAARMGAVADLYPWLAAEENGAILGYAYGAAFRTRHAYRFTVETTVYLREAAQGRGIGRLLYAPLLELLERQGFTQAIAAIALPNEASVQLHERLGFRHAGTYGQVGFKLGRWWDVGLWQRALAQPAAGPGEPLPLDKVAWPEAISRSG
ncbi:MAG TPA: arsinothricin resistance N-acetyltransferase ArsN1 family B [Allosphingosinicella sp.]|nr:arsinothricin resistance N-acetyltransferase ArsN1 family B [Allosphingosinicella sp.]